MKFRQLKVIFGMSFLLVVACPAWAQDESFKVVLMLDCSSSTHFKLEEMQSAAIAFAGKMRPQDSVMVIFFDERVFVNTEFTSNPDKISMAIKQNCKGAGTSLYDALYLVLSERLGKMPGRKAIILFSDGLDSRSRLTDSNGALEYAIQQDVFIHTLQYELPWPTNTSRARAERERATLFMKKAAQRTSGNYYEAATMADITQAFDEIAEKLRRP